MSNRPIQERSQRYIRPSRVGGVVPARHLSEKFYTIGRRFLQRTEADLPTIKPLVAQASQGNLEAAKHLARWAHRVGGSAGVFGFDDVTNSARRIEQLITDDPGPFDADGLSRAITQLTDALEAAARSRGLDR